ncbi:hypothetical protein Cgig2_002939 [Carnegiea gigantea]|uniref:Uncharacterized protein n=1 Tax=Carnegiea gigantea TaxID=171969 RepID=A0A9Q1GN58_9CARY|nr:hypothetical protein Cgig2_002939 [Carnegiea gigantea]
MEVIPWKKGCVSCERRRQLKVVMFEAVKDSTMFATKFAAMMLTQVALFIVFVVDYTCKPIFVWSLSSVSDRYADPPYWMLLRLPKLVKSGSRRSPKSAQADNKLNIVTSSGTTPLVCIVYGTKNRDSTGEYELSNGRGAGIEAIDNKQSMNLNEYEIEMNGNGEEGIKTRGNE